MNFGMCGRWRNGRLASTCTMAGTEECDFECPHRDEPPDCGPGGHEIDPDTGGCRKCFAALNPSGVPVVHDCPTCAHRDSPGAKGPCKSCTVLWKPENGGCEDNWTPVPAGVKVTSEVERLRAEQAAGVMPQIGPLLDAWEGMDNDTKAALREDAPDLARALVAIGRAMDGTAGVAGNRGETFSRRDADATPQAAPDQQEKPQP